MSVTNPAAASGASSSSKTIAAALGGNKTLGQDAFLKLLITQLKYQDPMKPMDDQSFIAQMAQFNSLEQLQTLNQNVTAQADFTKLTEASSLIGKTVAIKTNTENFPGKIMEVRKVDSVYKVMVQKINPDGTRTGDPVAPYDLAAINQVAG